MNLISRSVWKAKAPTGGYTRVNSTKGVKVHYTGGMVPPGIVDDHSICVDLVRQIQRMHMAGGREVPYLDIGYNLVCCPHRKVFMGRGPNHLPAANGPGLNTGHYAVLGLVGSKGFTQPNDDLLRGIRDAIEYLRKEGNAGSEIKGHRDGFPTDCPGGPLYAWVKRGAPRPGGDTTLEQSWMESLMDDLPLLREGADNFDVKTVRALLVARGGNPEDLDLLNTRFGPELTAQVKAFQESKKLDDDGIVGPDTWTALLRRSK